jgi:hypothetical protein
MERSVALGGNAFFKSSAAGGLSADASSAFSASSAGSGDAEASGDCPQGDPPDAARLARFCSGNRCIENVARGPNAAALPSSWRNLFGGKRPEIKTHLPAVNIISDNDKRSTGIFVPDVLLDHNIASMEMVLVGKFAGPRPNIDVVRKFVSRKWVLSGQVTVAAMAKGALAFRFTCLEDLTKALCGGPWLIGKSTLALKKWKPNMDLSGSFVESAPVWIKLPGLPMEFWNENIFRGIASILGDLLAIDSATAARSRLVHARLCVNVAKDLNLPKHIEISSRLGVWNQPIEYESFPFACYICFQTGHPALKCPNKKADDFKRDVDPKKSSKMVWKAKPSNVEGYIEGKVVLTEPPPSTQAEKAIVLGVSQSSLSNLDQGPVLVSQVDLPCVLGASQSSLPIQVQSPVGEVLQLDKKPEEDSKFSPQNVGLAVIAPLLCLPSNDDLDPNFNPSCSLASPELTIDLTTVPETPRGSQENGFSEVDTEQDGFITIGKKKKTRFGEKSVLHKSSMITRSRADVGKIPAPRGRRSGLKVREDETQQNIADGTQLTIRDVLSPKSDVFGRSAAY